MTSISSLPEGETVVSTPETDVDEVILDLIGGAKAETSPEGFVPEAEDDGESIIDNINETVIDLETTDRTILTIASEIDAQLVTMAALTPLANNILVALCSVAISPSRVLSSEQRNLINSSFLEIAWPTYESQRDFMPPMGSDSYQNLAIANCAVPAPRVLLPVITDAFDFIRYVNGIMGDVTKYESRVNEHTIHVLYQDMLTFCMHHYSSLLINQRVNQEAMENAKVLLFECV